MKRIPLILLSLALLLFSCNNEVGIVNVYTTTSDESQQMNPTTVPLLKGSGKHGESVITLDPAVRYQEMDGFGVAMTGSSCYNLLQMKPDERAALLKETFDPVDGYGSAISVSRWDAPISRLANIPIAIRRA